MVRGGAPRYTVTHDGPATAPDARHRRCTRRRGRCRLGARVQVGRRPGPGGLGRAPGAGALTVGQRRHRRLPGAAGPGLGAPRRHGGGRRGRRVRCRRGAVVPAAAAPHAPARPGACRHGGARGARLADGLRPAGRPGDARAGRTLGTAPGPARVAGPGGSGLGHATGRRRPAYDPADRGCPRPRGRGQQASGRALPPRRAVAGLAQAATDARAGVRRGRPAARTGQPARLLRLPRRGDLGPRPRRPIPTAAPRWRGRVGVQRTRDRTAGRGVHRPGHRDVPVPGPPARSRRHLGAPRGRRAGALPRVDPEGRLRQPTYRGQRVDRDPRTVQREDVQPYS